MQRQALVVVVLLLATALCSCGGSGASLPAGSVQVDPLSMPLAADGVVTRQGAFQVTLLDASFSHGGRAELLVEERAIDGGHEVTVTARAEQLRAALLTLDYPAERMHPVEGVEAVWPEVPADQLVRLTVLDSPPRVHHGTVVVHPQESSGASGTFELLTVRFADGAATPRRVAAVPTGAGSAIPDLSVEASSGQVAFSYYNLGDYNQNSLVEVADITPIGVHWDEKSPDLPPLPFPPDSIGSVVDGNSNGLIEVADITPIGQNWENACERWRVYGGSADDYPAEPTAGNGDATLLGTIEFPAETVIDRRLTIDETVDGLVAFDGGAVWLRPVGSADDEGIASNLVVLPTYLDLDIYQVDYTLDGDSVTDSEFGMVELTYEVGDAPQYFNLTFNDEWVIENVPLLPAGEAGTETTVSLMIPLDVTPGTDIAEADIAAAIEPEPRVEKPASVIPIGILTTAVNINNGTGALEALTAGTAASEQGGTVDGDNWAAHSAPMPNQEAKSMGCVPTAVSNSLKLLKQTHPVEMAGVDDSDIDIADAEGMTGFETGVGVRYGPDGTDWKLIWPSKKAKYMSDNGLPVKTSMIPPKQLYSNKAAAADCDAALQALKDGKDVELNGANHCAALVGMAKLTNGKYVMYVAHDTNQGAAGGQKIEKIIYDPSAASPAAEGGWAFNGKRIVGFTVEEPVDIVTQLLELAQIDFELESVLTEDSQQGELLLSYDTIPAEPVQYLNLVFEGEWVMKNLPVRSGGAPGEQHTLSIPFNLGVEDGVEATGVTYAFEFTTEPLETQPDNTELGWVEDGEFVMDSGEAGVSLQYTGFTTDPIWFINHNYTDAAFHPWSSIVNQDCGKNECAPTAISNSLKMLQASNPTAMAGLDIDIDDMKPRVDCDEDGSPAGTPTDAGAWWNLKKKWMDDHKDYPVQTDIVADKSKFDDMMQAIRDGKDVELRVPGHVVMVTGIVKLADGSYILEVAHDVKQGDDTKGTKIELIKYDPSTNTFDGSSWIKGKKMSEGGSNGCLFVVEQVSTVNVKQTDYTLDGVQTNDSGWGEVEIDIESTGAVDFVNLAVDGLWTVNNLPVPPFASAGSTHTVTVRFNLGVPDGTPLSGVGYGYSLTPSALPAAPEEIEASIVEDHDFIMDSGEDGFILPYNPPPEPILWHPATITDSAFHAWEDIVNQDCGPNECAPTAISNSLKTLAGTNPGMLDGLGIDIGNMEPATGWDADGAPAGTPEDPGAWWNLKDTWMQSHPEYPISTEIVTGTANFGDIMDALKNGQDVELRVPGHVVMVAGAIQLSNGDYILYVAHDTDQTKDGGTTIEPVYWNSNSNTFHGPGWIEGLQLSTGPGNAGCLFVIEDVIYPPPPPSWYIPIPSLVPDPAVPGPIPAGHGGMAELRDPNTDELLGSVPYLWELPVSAQAFWDDDGGLADPYVVMENEPLPPFDPARLLISLDQVELIVGEPPGVMGSQLSVQQAQTSGSGIGFQLFRENEGGTEAAAEPITPVTFGDGPVLQEMYAIDSFFDITYEITLESGSVLSFDDILLIDP